MYSEKYKFIFNFGFFPTKDMQTSPPSPFKSDNIYMKDEQCPETNEKSIFWLLYFELWSILFTIFIWITDPKWPKKILSFRRGQIYMKDPQCAESNKKSIFQYFRF